MGLVSLKEKKDWGNRRSFEGQEDDHDQELDVPSLRLRPLSSTTMRNTVCYLSHPVLGISL